MNRLLTAVCLLLPLRSAAQADTVRVGDSGGDWCSGRTVLDFQHAPLYGHNWPTMRQLPPKNWQARQNGNLIFPASGQAVALQFWLRNDAQNPVETVLEIDDLQLDRAKIWVEKADGRVDSSQLSGDKMPFRNRDIAFANPNFKIRLAAGETARVMAYLDQSGLFLGPRLRLWPPDGFAAYAARREVLVGLVLGVFFISLLVFSLFAAFGISATAKWYALFLGLQTLQMVNILGIGHQFLWPGSGLFSTLLGIVLPILGFLTLFKMLSVFLDLKERLPRWHRWLKFCTHFMAAYIGLGYALFLLDFQEIVKHVYGLGMALGTVVLCLAMACCARLWLASHDKKAALFLLAFVFGFVGSVVSWLAKAGVPVPFFWARYGLPIGFLGDLFIFNFLISRDLWQAKTQAADLKTALAEANREATANLLKGQEDERQRLSMALHDGVGIELGSIRRRLERHLAKLNGQADADARQLVADVANVAGQIREFSHALDPFSAKGLRLPDLLENLIFDFENNCPEVRVKFLKTGFQDNESQAVALISENEKHLFFIAAELLSNIAKHAQATAVAVRLESLPGGRLRLEVSDNGIGYDPAKSNPGVGLGHIRSRVQLADAAFLVRRRAGGGMAHEVLIPTDIKNDQNPALR